MFTLWEFQMDPNQPWLTLTDLGRLFGISAVFCGKLLSEAGLRDPDGMPNDAALDVAFRHKDRKPHVGLGFLGGMFHIANLPAKTAVLF